MVTMLMPSALLDEMRRSPARFPLLRPSQYNRIEAVASRIMQLLAPLATIAAHDELDIALTSAVFPWLRISKEFMSILSEIMPISDLVSIIQTENIESLTDSQGDFLSNQAKQRFLTAWGTVTTVAAWGFENLEMGGISAHNAAFAIEAIGHDLARAQIATTTVFAVLNGSITEWRAETIESLCGISSIYSEKVRNILSDLGMDDLSAKLAPHTTTNNVVQAFLELARSIPEVELIIEDTLADEPTIWTVISAPPFERTPRYRIYKAEQEALSHGAEAVDFHLINRRETPNGSIERIMPAVARVLFQRERTA